MTELVDSTSDLNAVDNVGNTALHYALCKRYSYSLPFIKYLLQKGANPNLKRNTGLDPVQLMIRSDAFTEAEVTIVVKYCLDAGY